MTVIVALIQSDGVWMGADSGAADSMTMRSLITKKIVKVGAALVGVAGSPVLVDLLNYNEVNLEPFLPPGGGRKEVYEFVDAFRGHLREKEMTTDSDGDKSITGYSQMLIAYEGMLYHIQHDFSILSYSESYDAIGSGEHFALAALEVITSSLDLDSEQALIYAMEVTDQFCLTVTEPFITEFLPYPAP